MIVAIMGPGGSGKSTTIEHLRQQGRNIVERKTSRSILSDWNVTIDQINSDPELTCKFQQEILTRKIADDLSYADTDDVWITERTPVDLFVYSLYSMGRLNHYSDFIDQYYHQCKQATEKYAGVIYLKGGVFPIVGDNIRSHNQHYTNATDIVMEQYAIDWLGKDKIIKISGNEGRWRNPIIDANISIMCNRYKNK